ncbi:receptor-type tyrosine-protein phosphatase eta [Paramormyrops kingsleyae]|uniref:receptor-type tyrosine-protein phosphatase eta n=1 Tax=Paramormyrops kingsleyae TaxID=1676925 RepID=UPI003B97B639
MGSMKTLVSSTLETSVHELKMYKIGLVLLVVYMGCWAERQYYPQGTASDWDDARKYCQLCFKELASLTAENMPLIASCLNGSYWVGLRKNLSGTMSWSLWSNGDPVTFQNWYPGWPTPPKTKQVVINQTHFPPEVPNNSCYIEIEDVCRNYTNYTKFYVYKEESEAPPPITQEVPVIEDTCVSVMSFGMWQDQNCSELKPYICYEDRFYGQATISNVTLNSSDLRWMAGPGNITNYRVEINGTFQNLSYDSTISYHTTSLDMPLSNLTPGMLYNVQVFPVKCSRDLNPENISFYTKPDQVLGLDVQEVQTRSVLLFWNSPVGGYSSYTVRVVNNSIVNSTTNESCWITGLLPGGFYEFAVYSEVLDKSIEGDPENFSTYTRPSNVKNLNVTFNNETSIGLMWDRPEGNSSGFLVEFAQVGSNLSNLSTSNTTVTLNNLTSGTKYQLSVVSLVPDPSLKGENVTITTYTNPNPISALTLNSNETAITASWNHPDGNVESYMLNISSINTTTSILVNSQTQSTISNLKSAAQYNVTVYAQVGNGTFLSKPVSGTQYTLPVRPGTPNTTFVNASFVTLTWVVPPELDQTGTRYLVTYNSTFWNESGSQTVLRNTASFNSLRSGTLYDFYIKTVTDQNCSDPVTVNATTAPVLKVITFMLQCSSNVSLFCKSDTAKNATLTELWTKINNKLDKQVVWNLKWNNKTAVN